MIRKITLALAASCLFLSPALASVPAFLGDLCASVTVRTAELIAKLPFAVTKFEKLPMLTAFLFYSAMALLSRYNLKRPAVKFLSGGAAFLLAAAAMLVF